MGGGGLGVQVGGWGGGVEIFRDIFHPMTDPEG